MSTTRAFVGVEGVGMRHSVAVMSDETGKIISAVRVQDPMTLHTTPRDLLQSRLQNLLGRLFRDAGYKLDKLRESIVCIGLTGVTFKHDRELVLPDLIGQFKLFPAALICTGDAEIVFASHTQRSIGSAIICHSGSTAYVVTKRNNELMHVRFGGWGPAIGDEGSGYWIGRCALQSIGEENNARQEPSVMWSEINRWLLCPESVSPLASEIPSWTEGSQFWRLALRESQRVKGVDPRTLLFHFAHQMQPVGFRDRPDSNEGMEYWRRIVSGLVTPVMEAHRKRDPTAQMILDAASSRLAEQHHKAFIVAQREFQANTVSPTVLYGGVLTHNEEFRALLVNKISQYFGNPVDVRTPKSSNAMRPACGALLFALGMSKTGALRLPAADVTERVLTDQAREDRQHTLRND